MSKSKTIIRISRGKNIESSRSNAILALNNFQNIPGQYVMVRYWKTEDTQGTENVDAIVAIGTDVGSGPGTYRIIYSGSSQAVIWGVYTVQGNYPDVASLAHGEVYLVKRNNDGAWCYCYAIDNVRQIVPITGGPYKYLDLSDNFLWYYNPNTDKLTKEGNYMDREEQTDTFNELWNILLNNVLDISFTSSISEFYVSEENSVTLNLTIAGGIIARSLSICDPNGNVIASNTSSSSLSATYTIGNNVYDNQTFTALVELGDNVKELTTTVTGKIRINSFSISPAAVNDNEVTQVNITAQTLQDWILKVEKVEGNNRTVIYGPYNRDNVDINYTVNKPAPGANIKFILTATNGANVVTSEEKTLTINDVPLTIPTLTVSPTSIYINSQHTLTFTGSSSRVVDTLSIRNSSETVLHSEQNTNSISYQYTYTPTQTGTATFKLLGELGTKTGQKSVNVTVTQPPYALMYYGNSHSELTTGQQVQGLTNGGRTTIVQNIMYTQEYFYIAVHSSCSLVSVMNWGIDDVTEYCILKNSSLVLPIYGETYKLYEISLNSEDPSDMGEYKLTITIDN